MEVVIKDMRFAFDQQTVFTNVVIGSRATAVSALMTADDLERLARIFSNEAKKLRGD